MNLCMHSLSKIVYIILLGLGQKLYASHPTEFQLNWKQGGTAILVRLYELSPKHGLKPSQTGIVDQKVSRLLQHELKDGKVAVWPGQKQALLLVIENPSEYEFRFSVAPHSTHPESDTLDFKFFCLCNGHVYKIPSGKTWYRLLEIKGDKTLTAKKIELTHTIIEVSKEPPRELLHEH